MIKIAGYDIKETLYESQRSLVYRAFNRQKELPVILKLLNVEYPTPEEFASFKREFAITRKLDIDGVIKAYSLEKYENSLVMGLEDFGGASPGSDSGLTKNFYA